MKTRRIFVKNFLLLLVLFVAPTLVIGSIYYLSYNRLLEKEIVENENRTMSLVRSIADNIMYLCQNQMNILSNDANISLFINNTANDSLLYDFQRVYKQIILQIASSKLIDDVYIYSDINKQIITKNGKNDMRDFEDKKFLNNYHKNQLAYYFWSEIRINNTGKKVLSIYKSVIFSKSSTGLIVYNIDFEKFVAELMTIKSVDNNDALFIANEAGKVVDTFWGDTYEYFSAEDIKQVLSDRGYKKVKDKIFSISKFTGIKWYIVHAISVKFYTAKLNSLTNIMVTIIIIGGVLAFLIALLVSKKIYTPFQNIKNLLKEPIQLMTSQNVTRYEEDLIISAVRKTIQDKIDISQELEERVLLLKKAQAIALQSQINPHFLYNTLDSINWSAIRLTGSKNETSHMIKILSSMLRYALDNNDTLVTFENEMNNAMQYVELQLIRYRNEFAVEYDIDENLKKYRIIKLVLQPIIENAIYHGVKPLKNKGLIKIKGELINNEICISIIDNGPGFGEDVKKRLVEQMESKNIGESAHIGMLNVHQRVRLFFGQQYGLNITTNEKNSTVISIVLPAVE